MSLTRILFCNNLKEGFLVYNSKRDFTSFLEKYRRNVPSFGFKLFPGRLKGTFLEKWANYWKNLVRDYSEAIRETYIEGKSKPKKSLLYLSMFGLTIYCFQTNPDDQSFRDKVMSYTNQIIFVGSKIRNPLAVKHLIYIENNYNQGCLERISFGVFSVMWKHNYSDFVCLYKSKCPYLGIRYESAYDHIVDIGFMSKWWILENKLKDYDVNPEEWM